MVEKIHLNAGEWVQAIVNSIYCLYRLANLIEQVKQDEPRRLVMAAETK